MTSRHPDRAADAAIFFDGSRLTLARQLAGLRKSDLASRLEKSPTAVAAWESGAKRPTASTVAQLALSLSVDPGFFVTRPDDVAALSSTPHFRSLRSTSQLSRDQAFAYGRLAIDISTGLEKHVEFPAPQLPHTPVSPQALDNTPENAARMLRQSWKMADQPAGHLIRMLENHGVLVVFSPEQTATVDAHSFDSRLRPVVVLNPIKRDYYRQRFDVAHELGHLVMHSDAEPGSRIVEDQANRFAAEFLMPAEQLHDLLPTSMGGNVWQKLSRLKEQWGVSIQALLYRARSLGRLSDVSYRNAMTTLTARGWRRSEPGLITTIEQPSLLPRALELLAQEGIEEVQLIDQCRVPSDLFRIVASRTPVSPVLPGSETRVSPGRVVSLLKRNPEGEGGDNQKD